MYGSSFLIHSAILCLLIGAFNPLTFKVIIGRYLFIAILLPLSYAPLSLTPFLSFSLSIPFSIYCRAGLEEVCYFEASFVGETPYYNSILIASLAG